MINFVKIHKTMDGIKTSNSKGQNLALDPIS